MNSNSNYPPGMTTGYQGSDIAELECPGCHTKFGVFMEYELGGGFITGSSEDVAVECLMCGRDLEDVPAEHPTVEVPQSEPYPEPYGPDPDTGETMMVTDGLTYVAFTDGTVLSWQTFDDAVDLCVAHGGIGFAVPE